MTYIVSPQILSTSVYMISRTRVINTFCINTFIIPFYNWRQYYNVYITTSGIDLPLLWLFQIANKGYTKVKKWPEDKLTLATSPSKTLTTSIPPFERL